MHHAEIVAHKVGEPFGTLVLALAVTAIELALIVSMMLAGGAVTATLARDTIFAAVMIILKQDGVGRPHQERDRLGSRPYGDSAWLGKPVAVMGASVGSFGSARAQYHLRQSFVFLNMHPTRKLLAALVAWTKRVRGGES